MFSIILNLSKVKVLWRQWRGRNKCVVGKKRVAAVHCGENVHVELRLR